MSLTTSLKLNSFCFESPTFYVYFQNALCPSNTNLQLFSCPGSFSQKFQTGLDTWIIVKGPDIDDPSHFFPTVMFYQLGKNHFQRDSVKGIVGLLAIHVYAQP